ncbi:MAG: VOC family protein [Alphaproteobacteria bacterium]
MHGRHAWYELVTSDLDAALAFYGNVVGWTARDAGMPGMTYMLLYAGDVPVAGAMKQPDEACAAGVPVAWTGYVGVEDVDAATAKVKSLGGAVHMEPMDIPGVGRFSIVGDPQGAVFALFTWGDRPPAPHAPRNTPGHIGWHELAAVDGEKAFEFYSALFGWRKGDGIDMGPMGIYQLFTNGDQPIGGMFTKPPVVPHPYWLYYFYVADFDPAVERLKAAGAQVINGPMEVPGGEWIVQAKDPQGVMFALVGRRG